MVLPPSGSGSGLSLLPPPLAEIDNRGAGPTLVVGQLAFVNNESGFELSLPDTLRDDLDQREPLPSPLPGANRSPNAR